MAVTGEPSSGPARGLGPPIVAIGASAGGVRALQEFFHAIPARVGAAFVVVVHLDPESHSDLAAILGAQTHLPVSQVQGAVPLESDHVYVVPPNRRLEIKNHELAAVAFEEPRGQRAPIDLFFRSLAEQRASGFAVVLTGSGTDGSIGVKAVKESGGIILVQDPEEAEYPSMPRSAIATGLADIVLPVRDLADQLVQMIRDNDQIWGGELLNDNEELVTRILAHVRARTSHDFSNYKRSTVMRRISRRIQITRTSDVAHYYDYLREHAEEAQALLNDLLISVTTFFRDGEAFEALAAHVVPQLFQDKEAADTVRVWVPGCATGEEAYSLGMLLLEELAHRDVRPRIQVFGSDLDHAALATARDGRYPAAIEADVSEERLHRFFSREGDHYRVKQELRKLVIFAFHSVLRDPPFSRMDAISCRNLLIYLDRGLQEQVLNTFHYALNPAGFLLLGTSETADNPPGLFRSIDRRNRIYQALASPDERPRVLPKLPGAFRVEDHFAHGARSATPTASAGDAAAHRQALEKIAPPSILVDEAHRVVHLSDNAGRYLQPAGGPFTGDIVELVREELRFDLRSALHRVFEQGRSTLSMPVPVRFNGQPHRVYFQVKPILRDADQPPRQALVMFLEGEAIEQLPLEGALPAGRATDDTVQRLVQELQATQARLRTTREESEAANEELRAANEELQSINEEYRSTSEELETSKEELQSINEELQTVNNELKLKLEAVSRANSDLQNLMAATDFGTLFLDPNLRIKRFTEHVTDLFNITSADEGRPITDFSNQLEEYDGLVDDARAVLAHLAPIRREVRSRNKSWYDLRLRPYRTIDDKIDGVVISFIDVTDRRRTEDALRESEERLRQQMQLGESSSERQDMILHEYSHRVKNTLAVVQAMAHQTMRTSQTNDEFIERFDARLAALADAHNLLLESNWRGAELGELARKQLQPYLTTKAKRIRIEGEPVVLPADLATPLGLVLHELATNAAKHGALTRARGSVSLTWSLEAANDPAVLVILWEESGGPPPKRSKESGFGSALIKGAIPAAQVKHEFRRDGVFCRIALPLRAEPADRDNDPS